MRVVVGDAAVGPLDLGEAMILDLAEDGRILRIRPICARGRRSPRWLLRLGLKIGRHPGLVRRALRRS